MNGKFVVTVLRMLLGWHFLYEGVWKLTQPGGWSSMGYLKTSRWFAAPVFQYIAETPALLRAVDLLNMWGLTLIGAGLFFGVLIRPAAFFGMVLLAFYYVAQPP
jgi:thiosulfate dehydrogenase [quinone] large subunit